MKKLNKFYLVEDMDGGLYDIFKSLTEARKEARYQKSRAKREKRENEYSIIKILLEDEQDPRDVNTMDLDPDRVEVVDVYSTNEPYRY